MDFFCCPVRVIELYHFSNFFRWLWRMVCRLIDGKKVATRIKSEEGVQCGTFGHTKAQCQHEKPLCYKCDNPGHIKAQCDDFVTSHVKVHGDDGDARCFQGVVIISGENSHFPLWETSFDVEWSLKQCFCLKAGMLILNL